MRRTALITGGAGFLGSNLVDELLHRGWQVSAYDNLVRGTLENLRHQMNHPRFSFVLGDVRDVHRLKSACHGASVIVHLAGMKIPRYGNALDTLEINNVGMKNVLDVAREFGARVIFASTSDVYGKNAVLPFSEESDLVIGPSTVQRWSYAVSKLFDEHLCLGYQEAYGLPVTILRFFGSYGPRQHLSWWGGPQAVFIGAILRSEELEIHGDGSQTRTFTYVTDTVAGIVAAVENEQANGEIFNIGNTRETSILDLALLIKALSGTPGPLKYKLVPYSAFGKYEDVMRRIPDIRKARSVLGFEPKTSLEEGLRLTIAWQRTVMPSEEKTCSRS